MFFVHGPVSGNRHQTVGRSPVRMLQGTFSQAFRPWSTAKLITNEHNPTLLKYHLTNRLYFYEHLFLVFKS